MQLAQSTVNKNRLAQGQPPINGVWFWGEGRLPAYQDEAIKQIWCRDVLAQGFAEHSQVPYQLITQQPLEFKPPLAAGNYLVSDDCLQAHYHLQDSQAWEQQRQALDATILKPLWEALRKHHFDEIWLYTDNNRCWYINANLLKRCWQALKNWRQLKPQ
jgi:hypothetical protein